MNIAIIGNNFECASNFRKDLIINLIQKNHKVYIFANNFNSNSMKLFYNIGAFPVNYDLNSNTNNFFIDILNIFKLGLKLKKYRIDLTLSYFLKPVITTSIASKLFLIKNNYIFFEGLGSNFSNYKKSQTDNQKPSFLLKLLLFISISFSLKSIVINKEDLLDLSKINKKILKNNLILGPIGLDLKHYNFSKIDTKNLKFIYIGRIHHEKGIRNLIEAAHTINQKYKNISFSIVGEVDPKSTEEFKLFIKNQKKYNYLNFHGYISDIRELLKSHSVLILPTFYREGSPRTIQESIACGRPFITTNIPGCKELLDNGMNGYQCKINDSTNLSKIIIDIINNKSDLEIKSQNCQKYSEKYLDSKIINERFIKFLGIK